MIIKRDDKLSYHCFFNHKLTVVGVMRFSALRRIKLLIGYAYTCKHRPERCPEFHEILKFVLNVLKFQCCPEFFF